MKNKYLFLGIVFLFLGISKLHAQNEFGTTESWLADDLTIKFPAPKTSRNFFNGVRLTVEPQLGVISPWGSNRLDIKQLVQIPKAGIETNLYKGYVALQVLYIAPTQVTFDEKSEVSKNGVLLTTDRKVQLDGGVSVGVSFLDGIIAIGLGYLNYDQRDFNSTNPNYKSNYTSDMFGYVNIQLLSALRSAIKNMKGE